MDMSSLAPLVFDLYKEALATSSKKTYRTGEKHFQKFINRFPNMCPLPFPNKTPSTATLTLCFFSVFLFLKKSIKSAATVKSYVRHVKNYWIQMGCDPSCFESEELTRVLKGISRRRPPKRDDRPAFLLPHYQMPLILRHPTSDTQCVITAAVIFGIFGLLRFHVFKKLNLSTLVLVDTRGTEHEMKQLSKQNQES